MVRHQREVLPDLPRQWRSSSYVLVVPPSTAVVYDPCRQISPSERWSYRHWPVSLYEWGLSITGEREGRRQQFPLTSWLYNQTRIGPADLPNLPEPLDYGR